MQSLTASVRDADLIHISSLPMISHLDLTEILHLTDAGLAHLHQLPLKRLTLKESDGRWLDFSLVDAD